jgi:hypothetical protein
MLPTGSIRRTFGIKTRGWRRANLRNQRITECLAPDTWSTVGTEEKSREDGGQGQNRTADTGIFR